MEQVGKEGLQFDGRTAASKGFLLSNQDGFADILLVGW